MKYFQTLEKYNWVENDLKNGVGLRTNREFLYGTIILIFILILHDLIDSVNDSLF